MPILFDQTLRPLDITPAPKLCNPIISPDVSTPGARPPQGGLCFFPKP